MNPTELLLTEARDFLADPKHWTKHAYYRDKKGNQITTLDRRNPQPASCCSYGAVYMTTYYSDAHSDAQNQAIDLLWKALAKLHDTTTLAYWQDNEATHQEVIEVFDLAIEYAKASQ